MVKREFWVNKLIKNKPGDKTKCKRVFKIKRDGRFMSRLVACGYSQLPGVDYTENHSLVINGITLRIILVL